MGLFANGVASLDGTAAVAGVHPQLCQHSVGYEAVVEHPVVQEHRPYGIDVDARTLHGHRLHPLRLDMVAHLLQIGRECVVFLHFGKLLRRILHKILYLCARLNRRSSGL